MLHGDELASFVYGHSIASCIVSASRIVDSGAYMPKVYVFCGEVFTDDKRLCTSNGKT